MYVLLDELLDGQLECSNSKYTQWYNDNKNKILPMNNGKSHFIYLDKVPQTYLKYMIFINNFLGENNCKTYQFFPLRTNIILKHIQLDTTSLINLLVNDKKKQQEYYKNIVINKDIIWREFFKLDKKIFKNTKKYNFDYTILTNGYDVSIRKIETNFNEIKNIKMKKRQDAANKAKDENKGKEMEERAQNKRDKINKKNIKEINQEKNKKNITKKENKKKKDEFTYIDDLTVEKSNELLKRNKVYVDPGKNNLFMMMDDNGKILRYSNKQRMYETKRLVYQKKIKKIKDNLNITQIENSLSEYNSKTCNYEKFKMYISKKNEVNEELMEKYEYEKFRKYKWYTYINTQKSNEKLIKTIKEKFGENPVIIMGDWSRKSQMKHIISTPNISLKRKIYKKIEGYDMDEYKTSCIHYKTKTECDNLYIPIKYKWKQKKGNKNNDKKIMKKIKIHSVLTYKMENKRMGCINRDKNSVNNIKIISLIILRKEKRPEIYSRKNKALQPMEPKKKTNKTSVNESTP